MAMTESSLDCMVVLLSAYQTKIPDFVEQTSASGAEKC